MSKKTPFNLHSSPYHMYALLLCMCVYQQNSCCSIINSHVCLYGVPLPRGDRVRL